MKTTDITGYFITSLSNFTIGASNPKDSKKERRNDATVLPRKIITWKTILIIIYG